LFGGNELPIVQRTRSLPLAQQLQQPPVTDAAGHQLVEHSLVDFVKERLNVGVYNPVLLAVHHLTDYLQRLVGTPLRPKPVGTVPKVRLEHRLQHHFGGGLDHPVPDGRNS